MLQFPTSSGFNVTRGPNAAAVKLFSDCRGAVFPSRATSHLQKYKITRSKFLSRKKQLDSTDFLQVAVQTQEAYFLLYTVHVGEAGNEFLWKHSRKARKQQDLSEFCLQGGRTLTGNEALELSLNSCC